MISPSSDAFLWCAYLLDMNKSCRASVAVNLIVGCALLFCFSTRLTWLTKHATITPNKSSEQKSATSFGVEWNRWTFPAMTTTKSARNGITCLTSLSTRHVIWSWKKVTSCEWTKKFHTMKSFNRVSFSFSVISWDLLRSQHRRRSSVTTHDENPTFPSAQTSIFPMLMLVHPTRGADLGSDSTRWAVDKCKVVIRALVHHH